MCVGGRTETSPQTRSLRPLRCDVTRSTSQCNLFWHILQAWFSSLMSSASKLCTGHEHCNMRPLQVLSTQTTARSTELAYKSLEISMHASRSLDESGRGSRGRADLMRLQDAVDHPILLSVLHTDSSFKPGVPSHEFDARQHTAHSEPGAYSAALLHSTAQPLR